MYVDKYDINLTINDVMYEDFKNVGISIATSSNT